MRRFALWTLALLLVLPMLLAAPAMGEGEPLSFTVTDIQYGGQTVGRVSAPAGWEASGTVSFGDNIEDAWLLMLQAKPTNGEIGLMSYFSGMPYLDILRWDGGTGHQDGQHNAQLHADMLHYKSAPAYCDHIAAQILGRAPGTPVADEQYPQATALLERKERELLKKGNALSGLSNVSVDWVDCTVCMRRYATEVAGVPSYLCVMAGVEGVQSTGKVPGIYADLVIQTISWKAPFTYTAICPIENWDRGSVIFDQFIENSAASDQFEATNERLTTELVNIIAGGPLSGGQTYSERVLGEEAASGDDYTDRYSDYLFDANDYTLSDGSHVKVSTAYDYVYEGDNGVVYYSDSAFAQPGGSTELTPNR
jgi:hypothetical protein